MQPPFQSLKAVGSYIDALPKAPAEIAGTVQTYAACHVAIGQGSPEIQAPALNRLGSNYITQQLLDFRSGKRGYDASDAQGTSMPATAKDIPGKRASMLLPNILAATEPGGQLASMEKYPEHHRHSLRNSGNCDGGAKIKITRGTL